MKSSKFVEELKGKSVEELGKDLVAAKKELFNLRFQNATALLSWALTLFITPFRLISFCGKYLAFIDPNLDAYLSVGGVSLCKTSSARAALRLKSPRQSFPR